MQSPSIEFPRFYPCHYQCSCQDLQTEGYIDSLCMPHHSSQHTANFTTCVAHKCDCVHHVVPHPMNFISSVVKEEEL